MLNNALKQAISGLTMIFEKYPREKVYNTWLLRKGQSRMYNFSSQFVSVIPGRYQISGKNL
jgi:hypothetical protein